MSGSDIPDRARFNPDDDMSDEEYLDALEEYYKTVVRNSRELSRKLEEAEERREDLEERVDRLTRENKALKEPSSYIATVEEVMDDQDPTSVVLEQHGSNQEVLTELPSGITVEAGDRVAIDDAFNVEKVLESGGNDARAQAMEVDRSPDVTYDDIGGLDEELQELREAVEQPLKDSGQFEAVGIEPPSGVLLHGPPGTGKTLMVKAVAKSTNATFIKLAGSELVQKFIGEGARLVRDLFELAEENQPAIIFIDEIDAIAAKRTDSKTSGDAEVQRTMMQLLNEMDGFEDRGDIRIVAATNRFDMLDDAILRPGRFDRLVEVGPPDEEGRETIFGIHTREMNIADDVVYADLAADTDGFTGAEIEAICTEAGMQAIRNERTVVTDDDFAEAIRTVQNDDDGHEVVTDYYR